MISAPPPPRLRPESAHRPHPMRAPTLLASMRFAWSGLVYLLRTQRNAQIHCVIALLAISCGFGFAIERFEWLVLAVTILIVLAAEGINTAVEAAVDLASPDFHPLAKIAKDVAAGTVLLTAIGAVVIGVMIFLPRIWDLLVRGLA